MKNIFSPYKPSYSFLEKLLRGSALTHAAITVSINRFRSKQSIFGASVEVTDRCNAGCQYCYVYPPEWDQDQRMKGYLGLNPNEHHEAEQEICNTFIKLKERGVVHLTLVGGETLLAPRIVRYAAALFPVVWVVTNGVAKFPTLPHSSVFFVSIDGPPEFHNNSRDPKGYFRNNHYENLSGMSAAIVRNINESERGAYVHITLTKDSLKLFSETVDWLKKDIKKLRGIVVSGAATKSLEDVNTLSINDRNEIKNMILSKADTFGWSLFPFNQPKVNEFLFDEKHIIKSPSQCFVARRVESVDFSGTKVGKCVLRDQTECETCVCNITGIGRAFRHGDLPTIMGVLKAAFG
jgi:MoaA/NifB/PqqE/SkfB family radical SAM enzyme